MNTNLIATTALFLCVWGTAAQAQPMLAAAEPIQVVNLSASAQQQLAQDWLRVVVRNTQDGLDAMTVQKQLKKTVDEALSSLRTRVQPRQLEVRSGPFGISPRYNEKGRVVGWQGQADLVIEGRDFAGIGQVAAELPRMVVESTQFSLSREARQQLEAEVQSQAVQNFRQKAQNLAKDFGFASYTLRQVNVGTSDRSTLTTPMMAMARSAVTDAVPSPVPLESGKDEVQITVSGSIVLR